MKSTESINGLKRSDHLPRPEPRLAASRTLVPPSAQGGHQTLVCDRRGLGDPLTDAGGAFQGVLASTLPGLGQQRAPAARQPVGVRSGGNWLRFSAHKPNRAGLRPPFALQEPETTQTWECSLDWARQAEAKLEIKFSIPVTRHRRCRLLDYWNQALENEVTGSWNDL
jgi:hypothetical protein